MDCKKLRDVLSEYIDGRLTVEDSSAVAAHLEDCPACRKLDVELRGTVSLVGSLSRRNAPEGFAEAVTASLERKMLLDEGAPAPAPAPAPAAKRRLLPWRFARVGLAAAAALLVAVYVWHTPTEEPSPVPISTFSSEGAGRERGKMRGSLEAWEDGEDGDEASELARTPSAGPADALGFADADVATNINQERKAGAVTGFDAVERGAAIRGGERLYAPVETKVAGAYEVRSGAKFHAGIETKVADAAEVRRGKDLYGRVEAEEAGVGDGFHEKTAVSLKDKEKLKSLGHLNGGSAGERDEISYDDNRTRVAAGQAVLRTKDIPAKSPEPVTATAITFDMAAEAAAAPPAAAVGDERTEKTDGKMIAGDLEFGKYDYKREVSADKQLKKDKVPTIEFEVDDGVVVAVANFANSQLEPERQIAILGVPDRKVLAKRLGELGFAVIELGDERAVLEADLSPRSIMTNNDMLAAQAGVTQKNPTPESITFQVRLADGKDERFRQSNVSRRLPAAMRVQYIFVRRAARAIPAKEAKPAAKP